jgi:ATP diphosphatase
MSKMEQLLEITAKLRDPEVGCPWDLEQTFETVAPYTLEEAYEVDHAIRSRDMAELCEELGDLLFQVALHSQMAHEAEHFDFADVVGSICDKLIRRHPHVFGDPSLGGERRVFSSTGEQKRHWEETKAKERAEKSAQRGKEEESEDLFRGIPRELPALARASKLQKRRSTAQLDIADEDVLTRRSGEMDLDLSEFEEMLDRLSETIRSGGSRGPGDRTAASHVVGALLTRIVRLAGGLGVDPEAALRNANSDFETEALDSQRRARGRSDEGEDKLVPRS